MAKKLLSESQVRKFMGLANLDANLSSNFLNEMYHTNEEEMEEGYKKSDYKMEEVVTEEEDEMEMDPMDDAADEGGEDLSEPADMDEPEEGNQELAIKLMKAVADVMGVEVDIGDEPAGEMEEPPAEEPEMEMDAEMEMEEQVAAPLSEEEVVEEVARRVAKRINEAARANKK